MGASDRIQIAEYAPFVLLMFAIVCVPTLVLHEEGLPRYRMLRAEFREIEVQNEALAVEIDQLRQDANALRNDPLTVEGVARDELGLARPDELIFQFPNKLPM